MIIYRDTKISYLIKMNKGSIEAIAAVAKPLEKLRNPLLRKVLAARTTLADAARMSGCDVERLGAALKPLGFEFVDRNEQQQHGKGALAASADFLKAPEQYPQITLDVRDDLASGADPLKKIIKAVDALPRGQVLRLINTFEPTPLIALLSKKGFEYVVEKKNSGEVHTFFKLKSTGKEGPDLDQELPDGSVDGATFEKELAEFGDQIVRLDVRGLEMPQPMVSILEALTDLGEHYCLLVTHQRIPVFLFSGLKERGFQYRVHMAENRIVRLLIFK